MLTMGATWAAQLSFDHVRVPRESMLMRFAKAWAQANIIRACMHTYSNCSRSKDMYRNTS